MNSQKLMRLPDLRRAGRVLLRFGSMEESFPIVSQLQRERQFQVAPLYSSKLATQRAEPKGIKKASAANLAGVGDSFPGPGLRPFVQEHNLRAVDNVRLDARYVDVLLNLAHPHHIMVR